MNTQNNKKTICIAGKNQIAVHVLHYLVEEFPENNYCVIPEKSDDGKTGWQPSLRRHAQLLKVPAVTLADVYPVENLIFLSLQFDSIIKPHLFASDQLFNIHFSALPKYKGMYPSILPILFGEKEMGVTLHKIDSGIDTGDIIDQLLFTVGNHENSRDLYQKYLDNSFILLTKNIQSILDKTYTQTVQSAVGSSYYSKKALDFSNIKIDLNKTAFEIQNQIRAFNFREFQLPKVFESEIYKAEISNLKSTAKPGTILFEDEAQLEIATIDFNIVLYKDYYNALWQACENGNLQEVKSFIPFIPDLNLRNKNGWNALILAAYNNHIEVARLLLENNALINATNYKGTTVAMYAFSCFKNTGDDTMLRLILSCNPELQRMDENEKSIFDYCKNEPAIINLLNDSYVRTVQA